MVEVEAELGIFSPGEISWHMKKNLVIGINFFLQEEIFFQEERFFFCVN